MGKRCPPPPQHTSPLLLRPPQLVAPYLGNWEMRAVLDVPRLVVKCCQRPICHPVLLRVRFLWGRAGLGLTVHGRREHLAGEGAGKRGKVRGLCPLEGGSAHERQRSRRPGGRRPAGWPCPRSTPSAKHQARAQHPTSSAPLEAIQARQTRLCLQPPRQASHSRASGGQRLFGKGGSAGRGNPGWLGT